MTRKTPWWLLALLAGCAPASDPADAPGVVTPLTLSPPPVYALLGYRQELSLTSEQISALDAVAERVRDRNAPLVDSLRSLGDRGGRGFITIDARTEPILERVRESNRVAAEEVREVLSEEQESTTCRLFAESRRRGMEGRAPGRRPRGGMMPDSAARGPGVGALAWPWCAPATGV